MRNTGAVVVITGVTTGVGRGAVRSFTRNGARVIGTGRRAELGRTLEEEVAGAPGQFTFVRGDIGTVADCERVMQTAVDLHGRIDVLINNAATVGDPAVLDSHEYTEEYWDTVMNANLKGAFFCSKFAISQMIAQGDGGLLLHIGSINGKNCGAGRMTAYTASKAGLEAMSKTLAVEYIAQGIRSNIVILGGAEGETGDDVTRAIGQRLRGQDFEAELPRKALRPMIMTADEVGDALVWLADPRGQLVNGADIAIDVCATAGLMVSTTIDLISAGMWKIPVA